MHEAIRRARNFLQITLPGGLAGVPKMLPLLLSSPVVEAAPPPKREGLAVGMLEPPKIGALAVAVEELPPKMELEVAVEPLPKMLVEAASDLGVPKMLLAFLNGESAVVVEDTEDDLAIPELPLLGLLKILETGPEGPEKPKAGLGGPEKLKMQFK